ncbi:MAG: methyltransferase [Saprospiraceae bacterium]
MKEKLEILQVFVRTLRENHYSSIQYIPSRKSIWGLFKEFENLVNLFSKKKHLLFYYSIYPGFYLNWIAKKDKNVVFFYKFCFLNQAFPLNIIQAYFDDDWISEAVDKRILVQKDNGTYELLYSIIPIDRYFILRDSHHTYQYHEYDADKPQNRVYVGADSVKFAASNQKYLSGRKFKSVLELGCGTGIQLICIENLSEKVVGVDINSRAVEFTKLSVALNELSEKIDAVQSDLFGQLGETYDLILANPWFIDIEKAGLEEIPDIVQKLDEFLDPGGVFAIYFGSYIKDGIDQGRTILSQFALEKGYDAVFYQLGRTVEPAFLTRYKVLNISHIESYYALLTKSGTPQVRVVPPSIFRQFRDVIFLSLQRFLK